MSERKHFDCAGCDVYSCWSRKAQFPEDCPGGGFDRERVLDLYKNDGLTAKITSAAAVADGSHTRVQETIAFARRLGVEKVGIAACIGLINEAKVYAKILDDNGIANYCANCKVGSVDVTEVCSPEELGQPDRFRAACNPILQAEILNRQGTGLNVVLGLCIGHDSLFSMYSDAPVTTLVVKDRVLKNNPAAALTP